MSTTTTVKQAATSKAKLNLLLDIALLLMLLIVYEVRATGEAIHEWIGVAMTAVLLVHIILHWDWVMTMVRRFVRKLAAEARLRSVLNVAIFIAFTAVMFSGLLISETVMPFIGLHLEGSGFWHWLHGLAADAIVWLIALHIGLNWRWIVKTTQRYLITPVWQRMRPTAAVRKAESL
jgi:hypothetical protein